MRSKRSSNLLPLIFLGVSFIALWLLPLLIIGVSTGGPTLPWERQIVGTIFMVILLLGTLAGITPTHCSRLMQFRSKLKEPGLHRPSMDNNGDEIKVKGHHPTCGQYSTHVIQIGTKTYCTGCTGLVIGALIALVGSGLYFFFELPIPGVIVVFWVGILGIAIGLLQHIIYRLLKVNWSVVRISINVFFVVGGFFLLASVVEIASSLVLSMYLLLSIIYWVFTRILMSKREHHLICTGCRVHHCPSSKA